MTEDPEKQSAKDLAERIRLEVRMRVPQSCTATFYDEFAVHLADAIVAISTELDEVKEKVGQTRMCVNCGKTVDADKVKRGDDLPECVGPEGLSACTFDLTPQEAWQHWRGVAHQLRDDVARLAKDLCAARNAALDEAARFVEEHDILHTSAGDVLEPRREGNRSGLAFASGIRSLKTEEPPQ